MKLKLTFKFVSYSSQTEVINKLEYKIVAQSTVYPTIASVKSKDGDVSNHKGLSREIITDGFKGYYSIYIKGYPTKYNTWTLVKRLKIDTGAYVLRSIEYSEQILVKVPVDKICLATSGEASIKTNHRSEFYEVKKGDTVESIANKFGVEKDVLLKNNGLAHEYKIYVSQRLYIKKEPIKFPKPKLILADEKTFIKSSHIVRRGDTLTSIGKEYGISPSVIAIDNNIEVDSTLKVGMELKLINHKYFNNAFERIRIDTKMRSELIYSSDKGFPTELSIKKGATQASVSLGVDFFNFVGAVELGFAYDVNGNKMLYVSTIEQVNLSTNIINNIISDIQAGKGTAKDVIESYKKKGGLTKRKWSVSEIKKQLKSMSFTIGDSVVRTNAQHVEDLEGSGISKSNSVNLVIGDLSRINTTATTNDGRIIDGSGYGASADVNKSKSESNRNAPHVTNSYAASQTYGLFIIDPYKRFSQAYLDKDPIIEIEVTPKD
ncbi:LysM peptidoglycan-binding domain-containing protein [Acinetobacter sp. SH20PTE14]|uniref:LysM peptidoglycan-binding domain-containing protein n=1 Tax=Acinetobacter sp. SH20PTE14 TaxID=2905879 RepID=UPI001F171B81|nr:LysM domain-containing protein [Acinetobacter sp. SH20PTE14]UIJ75261.1 LysM peptidoglycan-binding domain-containing protein [Acinetobacter sp. SH20PTE14]